jgi:hypothetical protein
MLWNNEAIKRTEAMPYRVWLDLSLSSLVVAARVKDKPMAQTNDMM